MKAIKLTLVTFAYEHSFVGVCKKTSKEPIWINPDHVLSVKQMTTVRDTYYRVNLRDGVFYDVLENPASIFRRK